ncbi:Fur family transcriptional regulator [Anaerosporobacter faecicola]|uniref:Fur family transcriptional regulator n=1 Tax=Anaerosporobacter faecicola TaxID=2718714 RepID=UPI00143B8F07|nr:transcriptional repressor [Anaerosporobacter faecicola]
MATQKFSRQREAIKEYLASTTCHPTADTVYLNIKKEYPNISLGTVYRNLNLLAEQGEILKISCGDGSDHFDGNVHPHYHFLCKHCGSVLDLRMESIDHINTIASASFPGQIDGHTVYFYGLCEDCKLQN